MKRNTCILINTLAGASAFLIDPMGLWWILNLVVIAWLLTQEDW